MELQNEGNFFGAVRKQRTRITVERFFFFLFYLVFFLIEDHHTRIFELSLSTLLELQRKIMVTC